MPDEFSKLRRYRRIYPPKQIGSPRAFVPADLRGSITLKCDKSDTENLFWVLAERGVPSGQILREFPVTVDDLRSRLTSRWVENIEFGVRENLIIIDPAVLDEEFPIGEIASSRTAMYRYWDVNRELLYIGISINPFYRARSHQQTKTWYESVDHITLQWFDDRATAEEKEQQAIRDECPIHNVLHNRTSSA